jgi:hypothetical protein
VIGFVVALVVALVVDNECDYECDNATTSAITISAGGQEEALVAGEREETRAEAQRRRGKEAVIGDR